MNSNNVLKTGAVIGLFVATLAFINSFDKKAVALTPPVVPDITSVNAGGLMISPALQMKQEDPKPTRPPAPKKTVYRVRTPSTRTLFLYGEVAENNSALLAESIKSLNNVSKEPIFLMINSPGGSVLDGALVVSAIEASEAPVFTVCVQICASMAAIIHQYGKERMMSDRSIIMFHPAAGGFQGPLPQISTRLNLINTYVNKMTSVFAERAGLTLDNYNELILKEMWFDAEDATARKFNDKIVSVTLPTNMTNQSPDTNRLKQQIDLDWK